MLGSHSALALGGLLLGASQSTLASTGVELVGFASLPADTFAEGPAAGGNRGDGTPVSGPGRMGPFPGQPVQGFSAVQFAPTLDDDDDDDGSRANRFWFLSDNGFGGQGNSSDYLLRIYKVAPAIREPRGRGDGSVKVEGFVQLRDPHQQIPFNIIHGETAERRLTGSDFDVESFVIDAKGDIWVGDEFGPFILHFDRTGLLLEAPIPTPDLKIGTLSNTAFVRAPQNPFLAPGEAPNLRGSRGYEGMAFSPDRKTLYPMLEGTVAGDPEGALRIYGFSVLQRRFSGLVGLYQLSPEAGAIGDLTPINEEEFLIIERDGGQGPAAQFKKIFKINLKRRDSSGFVEKVEVVDLLNINDPNDLNQDGKTRFTFPFVTIENVLVLDDRTILVANDNNYPFSLGRGPDIDNNEIIVLRLPEKLGLDPRLGVSAEEEDDD